MDPIENVLCYMGKRPCDNVDGKYIYVCCAPKLEKWNRIFKKTYNRCDSKYILLYVLGDSTNSEIADIIVNATGIRGSNASYATNLAQGLRNLDISQSKAPQIFQIEKLVKRKLEGKLNLPYLFIKDVMNEKVRIILGYIRDKLYFLVKKQEEYLKRALDYYFNKVDTDKNGVVTVPEFMKLALSFSEENKDDDSVVAEVSVLHFQVTFLLNQLLLR